ncbi:hypothetical protein BSLG_005679 [Batrachochytrium salamandrivorans]|nr:hypothetical protein BSLG_005679 [Batrachochytrium salamandrivorans]
MPSATAPVLGSFARGISKKSRTAQTWSSDHDFIGQPAGQGSMASSAHSGHLLSSASTIGAYSASSTISAGLSTVQPASRYPHHIYLSTIAPIAEKQQDEANCKQLLCRTFVNHDGLISRGPSESVAFLQLNFNAPAEHQLDNLSHSHENMSTSQNKQFLAQLQVRMPSTQPVQDIQQYTSAHPRCSTTTLLFLTPPSDFSSFLDLDRPKNDALSDEFTNNAIQSSAGLSGSNILQASATASLTKPDILHNAFYGLRSILYEMSDTDQSLPTLEQTLPGFDTPATSQT